MASYGKVKSPKAKELKEIPKKVLTLDEYNNEVLPQEEGLNQVASTDMKKFKSDMVASSMGPNVFRSQGRGRGQV